MKNVKKARFPALTGALAGIESIFGICTKNDAPACLPRASFFRLLLVLFLYENVDYQKNTMR